MSMLSSGLTSPQRSSLNLLLHYIKMACSAVRSSGGVQVKLKSNPDEFWDAILNSTKLFPTAIPSLYATIFPTNADGTVRNIKYGHDSPLIKESEEQINGNQKPKFSYTVLSGDILKYYTSFRAEISIVSDEDGTWAKWTWETDFPNANNPLEIGVDLEELAMKTLAKLDDYLLRA